MKDLLNTHLTSIYNWDDINKDLHVLSLNYSPFVKQWHLENNVFEIVSVIIVIKADMIAKNPAS